jgi:hypothetical protein
VEDQRHLFQLLWQLLAQGGYPWIKRSSLNIQQGKTTLNHYFCALDTLVFHMSPISSSIQSFMLYFIPRSISPSYGKFEVAKQQKEKKISHHKSVYLCA